MRKTYQKISVFLLLIIFSLTGISPTGALSENEKSAFLKKVHQDGKEAFFSELLYRFGLHPEKFNLLPESIYKIQNAKKEIPYLYENLITILYIREKSFFQALLEEENQEALKKFREKYLKLSVMAADHFICSLFERTQETHKGAENVGFYGKSRLEWVLFSISSDGIEKRKENKGVYTGYETADLNTQWGYKIAKFREAQKFTKGKGIRVAILDTGIDLQNEDGKKAGIIKKIDFCPGNRTKPPWEEEKLPKTDKTGHGTLVAALVLAGAPEAEISVYGSGHFKNPFFAYWPAYKTAQAIYKAVSDKSDIILVSSVFSRDYKFLKDACQFAYDNNVVLVSPNHFLSRYSPEKSHYFPAHYNMTIAVAGVVPDLSKRPVAWEETGASHYTSVSASAVIGKNINRNPPDNSLAAASVAGLAALISSRTPKTGSELGGQYFQRVYEILTRSADPHVLGYGSFDPRIGYGLINAERSVNQELETYLEKMKEIEDNFKRRMKEREKQQEEKKKTEDKKKKNGA